MSYCALKRQMLLDYTATMHSSYSLQTIQLNQTNQLTSSITISSRTKHSIKPMNPTNDEDPALAKLELARSNLKTLLQNSRKLQTNLSDMDRKLTKFDHSLLTTSQSVAPLHSLAISARALDARVNRALSPALSLLSSFKLADSIQQKLIKTSSKLQSNKDPDQKLGHLIKYVDYVGRLNGAIDSIGRECEPAIQKLQEVVEFLGRTKATDRYQTLRLRETLVALRALYRDEIDAMRYEGVLDEALVSLQDEFERVLVRLKHRNVVEIVGLESLGSELEVELLKRIAETLGRNDCLDICIDIYVKGRYKRAAKALMRLNPQYLRTYAPEDIHEMEWEHLETAIALWIQHFELALKTVLVSEKNLCNQVLGGLMDGVIWPECFVKIADKIMAVFFRFGEGVARSSKEPQKLFKLLDMFDSLEKLKPEFYQLFEGEAGADICSRFRELEKLLVHSSSKVLWEFGLQIESNNDGLPPPQDGSVPKLVRYAINYLKYLISNYSASMARILRTEQIWKAGVLAEPEPDDYLLKDAITNVMEAIERNTNAKKTRYKDKVLAQIFIMNTYWYIYMRSRNTDLGRLMGDKFLKRKYKVVAEESAYMYQKLAWGPVVMMLDSEEIAKRPGDGEGSGAVIRGRMEGFMKGFDENVRRHRSGGYRICDEDLRVQIREATVKFVGSAYGGYLSKYSSVLEGKSVVSSERILELLGEVFGGGGGVEVVGEDGNLSGIGGTSERSNSENE